jgi:AcrR family transcriptional regulator
VGIAERKERDREELREKILDAARDIVLADGFEGLTMRKIGEAIEYSPGTVYLHFAGRDDLAMAVCRQAFDALLEAFGPAAAVSDPYERLFAVGRAYVKFAMEYPQTYRLMFMLDPKFSSDLMSGAGHGAGENEPGERAYGVLRETVAELVQSGRFRAVDPDVAAQVLWMSMHGIVSLKLNMPDYPDFAPTGDIVDLMQDALSHGMLARP